MTVSGPYILIKSFNEEYDFFEAVLLFVDIDDIQFHMLGNKGNSFSRIRSERVKKFTKDEYTSKPKNMFRYSETPKPGDILKSTYHFKDGERFVTLEKEESITIDDFFKQALYKCIDNLEDLRELKINQLERNYTQLYKFLENGSIKTKFQS